MIQLDYTFDRQIELERDDAGSEGIAEGRAEGRAEGQSSLVSAVKMIRAGMATEELLNKGFDLNTIELAFTIK